MTPPPAATAAGRFGGPAPRTADPHRRRVRRSPAPRAARRVSGTTRTAVAGGAIAERLPRAPRVRIARPRLRRRTGLALRARLGGLLRSRAMIVALAVMLLGLVFLQVSLLKLNTAISQNVERAQVLERDNAVTRAEIARLDAGRRIQDVAAQLGMVMPGAGALCYLDARRTGGCTGGDPAAAATAVDPSQSTAPPVPAGADAPAPDTSADPAAADPQQAADPAAQAPAPDPAAPAADPQQQAADPAAPAADPQQQAADPAAAAPAAPDPSAGATGGLAASTGAAG